LAFGFRRPSGKALFGTSSKASSCFFFASSMALRGSYFCLFLRFSVFFFLATTFWGFLSGVTRSSSPSYLRVFEIMGYFEGLFETS
jgi:hypothetical protein